MEYLATDETFQSKLDKRNEFTEQYFEALERAQSIVTAISEKGQIDSRGTSTSQGFLNGQTVIEIDETQVRTPRPLVNGATTIN